MTHITITVHGHPAGQAAISHNRQGRGYHTNAKRLHPWRKAIHQAATTTITTPLTGPLLLEATVTVPLTGVAARSIRKTGTAWPQTRSSSDWDHHARAICDALTGVAYLDDAQIVEGTVRKVYPGQGVDALDQPGAVIRITPLEEQS